MRQKTKIRIGVPDSGRLARAWARCIFGQEHDWSELLGVTHYIRGAVLALLQLLCAARVSVGVAIMITVAGRGQRVATLSAWAADEHDGRDAPREFRGTP